MQPQAAEFIRITLKVKPGYYDSFARIVGRLLDDIKASGAATPYNVEFLNEDTTPRAEVKQEVAAWEERTGRTLLPPDWNDTDPREVYQDPHDDEEE